MVAVAAISPHLRRLGEEHAIGECNDKLPPRPGDPQQVGSHRLGILQILPTGNDQAGIDTFTLQRNPLIAVEVLHPAALQPWIGIQFPGVEAVADDAGVGDLFGQVRHPARHQIKNHRSGGNALAVELGEPLTESRVEMVNETRFGIKELIVTSVPLASLRLCQHLHHHGGLSAWDGCSLAVDRSRRRGKGSSQPMPRQIIDLMVAVGEYLREHFKHGLCDGFDPDITMLRITAMTMRLHRVEKPDTSWHDSLSKDVPKDAEEHSPALVNTTVKYSLEISNISSDPGKPGGRAMRFAPMPV
jgi:hypothetical protein